MKARTSIVSLSVTGLALAGTLTLPARADLTTQCVGTGGAVTVPGALVVPAGKSCVLTKTTVEGKVTVRSGASLVTVGASLKGAVSIAENGYVDGTDTTIGANVVSHGAYGVYLDTSTVGGAVRGYAAQDASIAPLLFFTGTSLAKSVRSDAGELLVQDSQVGGSVTGHGTAYTDVLNSTLERGLAVTGNNQGSAVCSSEVLGDLSYDGNGPVQLGGGKLLDPCDQVNYFGGDVTINDTTGGVEVNGNIIAGNLTGTGNDPAPVGHHNRVRGTQGGQFADLGPAAPAPMQSRMQSRARAALPVQDRVQAATAQAKRRTATATASAAKAGPAHL